MKVLLLALALDVLVGDPPNRFHPVAWVGRLLAWSRRLARPERPALLILWGGTVLAGALGLVCGVAALVSWGAGSLGSAGLLLEAGLLKCTFSLRGLIGAATRVAAALESGTLMEARGRVGRDLVSRPTDALSAPHVASAAVESVAENLTDSVVAPLFYFLLGGLPGAWAYRVVNTADAMWGYRQGELEHFGKPAARLDDLLNWVPARLAALAIVLGAVVAREAGGSAWKTMWSQHGRTASPNAGWTMAAMAGALGVALEKPGGYRLGSGELPTAGAIGRAVRVIVGASGFAVALLLAATQFAR